MRFTFDSGQPHQRAALDAAIDLFKGHPRITPTAVTETAPDGSGIMAVPNHLALSDSALLKNLRRVQARSPLPLAPGGADSDLARIVMPFPDEPANGLLAGKEANFPNFSVEMETGTGKTYVYLRTIRELARLFGFLKFIVVVPSIAVREGVLHAMKSSREHFNQLCGIPCESVRYNSARLGEVSAFARNMLPRAMVMTIDSFRSDDTLMRRSSEKLIGETPLHFIQASRPILILDEPQNMETKAARESLARLNPLFALRYSATHRRCYNMIHRLSPMRAYRAGLVKRLTVDGVESENANMPRFRLVSVNTKEVVPSAKVEVDIGAKRKRITMRRVDTLEDKTGLPLYRGFQLETVSDNPPGAEFFCPSGYMELKVGETYGEADKEELFREQIAATIQSHVARQRQLRKRGIKVLSLFFIDKVDNYRVKHGDQQIPLIRRLFEEEFEKWKGGGREWKNIPADAVHAGYFAKSMGGNTEADANAYQLIMRDKESLLTFPDEKRDDAETLAKRRVAFIFSHSALREGWDNPNIFQICTLNETHSETRKRQEIGRGVRLAVDQDGNRVLDNSVNILTVIPNRNYAAYVSEYQREVKQDYAEMVRERFGADWWNLTRKEREWAESYGQEHAPLPPDAKRESAKANKRHIKAGKGGEQKFSAEFQRLWERIQQKTEYIVNIDSDDLVKRGGEILRMMRIPGMEIIRAAATMEVTSAGVFEARPAGSRRKSLKHRGLLPDAVRVVNGILSAGSSPLMLSRPTICRIVKADVKRAASNPYGWSRCAADAIRQALAETLKHGIVYEKVDGDMYQWRKAYEREFPFVSAHIAQVREAENAAYDAIPCDSDVEKKFAEELAKRADVKLFLKLPRWFVVPTPVGDYNPDWAILLADGKGGEKLVLVAETKGGVDQDGNLLANKITPDELAKIYCGMAHFGSRRHEKKGALDGTDFRVVKESRQLFPGGR